ncbi:hypothetical protein B0H11DRAFT_2194434 [Mycena galericulata]|nr:hypothetical protein B0H11DRAFT_2194434 [Mycena galericulata]
MFGGDTSLFDQSFFLSPTTPSLIWLQLLSKSATWPLSIRFRTRAVPSFMFWYTVASQQTIRTQNLPVLDGSYVHCLKTKHAPFNIKLAILQEYVLQDLRGFYAVDLQALGCPSAIQPPSHARSGCSRRLQEAVSAAFAYNTYNALDRDNCEFVFHVWAVADLILAREPAPGAQFVPPAVAIPRVARVFQEFEPVGGAPTASGAGRTRRACNTASARDAPEPPPPLSHHPQEGRELPGATRLWRGCYRVLPPGGPVYPAILATGATKLYPDLWFFPDVRTARDFQGGGMSAGQPEAEKTGDLLMVNSQKKQPQAAGRVAGQVAITTQGSNGDAIKGAVDGLTAR